MRIVLFNYTGAKPNPVYDVLAKALSRRGHTVIIGAADDSKDLIWYDARGDILARVPGQSTRTNPSIASWLSARTSKFSIMQQVRQYVIEMDPDIVQVNTGVNPWMLALNLPDGVQAAYDIRQINESVDQRLQTRLRERLQLERLRILTRHVFEHTFFCHHEAARHIAGEDWQRVSSVIPVGVDDRFLEMETSSLANPAENEPLRFVYVGTLSRLRNLQQLMYAADILRRTNSNFRVTLVGPDRSDGYYQRTIDQLDLGEYVTMEPPVAYETVPTYLAGHHIGLAYVPDRPTWHYQPTIKILEYRALGMPILSTDVASHREYVQDGVNGVMVSDSPESIAAGMRRFVENRGFLERVMSNARQMRRGLTWDEIAAEYERVYRQLLAQNEL